MAETDNRKAAARKELARRELAKRQKEKKRTTQEQFRKVGGAVTEPITTLAGLLGLKIPSAIQSLPGGQQFQQGVGRGVVGGANIATGGIPAEIAKRGGEQLLPPAQTAGEKAGEFVGTVGGLVAPGSLIAKGSQALIKGAGAGAKIGRAALTGGGIGAIIPPETSFNDLKARGRNVILGALIGAGSQVGASAIQSIKNIKNAKQGSKFVQKIREKFFKVKSDAVAKFGTQVDDLAQANPDKQVSIRDIVDDINNPNSGFDPEVKRILRKIPGFDRLLADPSAAEKITLREAQNMLNHINTKIPPNIKARHLDLLDTRDNIRAAQLDAFPEMQAVKEQYKEVIRPWTNLKNQFKFNRLQTAIENNFGGAEGRNAIETLLPEGTVKQIDTFRKTARNLKLLGKILDPVILARIAIGSAVAGGAIAGARKFQD
ncbi:MAG TPA: hypothetical protein ENI23_03985 [bacterium]|nr:hypothetical protein [bacterium]